MIRPYA